MFIKDLSEVAQRFLFGRTRFDAYEQQVCLHCQMKVSICEMRSLTLERHGLCKSCWKSTMMALDQAVTNEVVKISRGADLEPYDTVAILSDFMGGTRLETLIGSIISSEDYERFPNRADLNVGVIQQLDDSKDKHRIYLLPLITTTDRYQEFTEAQLLLLKLLEQVCLGNETSQSLFIVCHGCAGKSPHFHRGMYQAITLWTMFRGLGTIKKIQLLFQD